MSFEPKQKGKKNVELVEMIDDTCDNPTKTYDKKCSNNKKLLEAENENRIELGVNSDEHQYLYPTLNDPNFNVKIAQKKEFVDTKYDGTIYNIEEHSDILSNAEYELLPQQAFVRNFMSFQTPYNSLLLFHGLGSGKTCSAIGVCEEMRDYLKQMGISKQIIIVASPNVQDNFKLQLFDERKLKEVDGIWTIKGCLGNKLLKEINPTGMKGLKKEKIIQNVKNLINASYQFVGYLQFSNEIVRQADLDNPDISQETKIRSLQNIYNNSLVVIDEVHNIRISDDNENKNVAKNLMFLVNVVENLRLLLLSATPMFNSYKEIIWLINLMNMNDRRGIVGVSDIFNKNGDFKTDQEGDEIGKDMLIRKVTGYVSYVRGENPYTFPFRVYPNTFAPEHTFKDISEYPKCQINGKHIPDNRKIEKLSLYLTAIGKYQSLGYKYIVDRLRSRQSITKQTRTGKLRNMPSFNTLTSFGYTDLMIPIEALNIVYPLKKGDLELLTEDIEEFKCVEEEEEEVLDLTPIKRADETDVLDEIDDVLLNGPKKEIRTSVPKASEIVPGSNEEQDQNEQVDATLLDASIDVDKSKKSNKKKSKATKKTDIEFDIKDDARQNEPVKSFSKSVIKPQVEGEVEGDVEGEKIAMRLPKSDTHVIEEETRSNRPTVSTKLTPPKKSLEETLGSISSINSNSSKGGKPSPQKLYINPKELTGTDGLKRIMEYTDTKTPAIKGGFEYRRGVPHIFETDQIGLYSSKIKHICDSIYDQASGKVSEGIILIYSAYIDSGLIPMALALEEMGFQRYGKKAKSLFKSPPTPIVDVRTMDPPSDRKNFKPARYVMITGDPRISPDNDADVKAITSDDNIFETNKDGEKLDISGSKIKVVLISQAGSEGLDFKAIRQIHIMEPWYNMNRNEQIIGRGVRNFSHKDLPFEKRNVEIFLYGTLLENTDEEAADLYVYRISEIKAIKIGKVTRLLKETSVDCIINHDQTQFTNENFSKIPENKNIRQVLSTGLTLDNFEIGDLPNSATCDYMDTCEFKCLIPDPSLDLTNLNSDTYNEAFMLVNSDKIIQKIKMLMKQRFFYKKRELLQLINIPKKYPTVQIYAALTQIINDNTEYISDKYNRTGYLVNIGDYYLFQPSELNYKNISIYDRSVPLDFKHEMIKFEIRSNVAKPVIDKRGLEDRRKAIQDLVEVDDFSEGKEILTKMYELYQMATKTSTVERGNKNWYEHCGIVIVKMNKEGINLEILITFLIEHIVDSLMMVEKVNVLNFIYSNKDYEKTISDKIFKRFISTVRKYLFSKIISYKKLDAMVIYNGSSRVKNLNIFVLRDGIWVEAEPEDKLILNDKISERYEIKQELNKYVGFIGFETNKKYMVYKIKDTTNDRSTGFRCDQSGKENVIEVLNEIEKDDPLRDTANLKKDSANELCIRQEFTLRNYQITDRSKIWFLDTETAIYNEFEKREKK
jgi:superfamily II DNA or RNA helicase